MNSTNADLMNKINTKGKVYIASGWFNPTQMNQLESIKSLLSKLGFEIFSPKDSNLVPADAGDNWRQLAFEGNIIAIKNSSFMVCNTQDKDLGTIFESGVAYTSEIPIIYYAEGLSGPFNLMLAQSGVAVATSIEDLESKLSDAGVLQQILDKDTTSYEGLIE